MGWALAQSDATVVVVNASEKALTVDFVLLGREVCESCADEVIAPGGVYAQEVPVPGRFLADLVGGGLEGSITHRLGSWWSSSPARAGARSRLRASPSRPGGVSAYHCDVADRAERKVLGTSLVQAAESGRWSSANFPMCEVRSLTNTALGEHTVVWLNQSSAAVQIGGLGADCAGCEARMIEAGAASVAQIPPGTQLSDVPVAGGDLHLVLDLSEGGLDRTFGSGQLRAHVLQEMGRDRQTLTVVRLHDEQ